MRDPPRPSRQTDPASLPAERPTGGIRRRISRREALALGGTVALAWGLSTGWGWWRRNERGLRSEVFIGQAPDYAADLVGLIAQALQALGITRGEIQGKRVLLKPNLVEPAVGQPHINTHPAVVLAAAEVFGRLDAAEVIVAEGQGHRRDSWLVLEESGMMAALDEAGLRFVDLNHDEVVEVPNAGSWSELSNLFVAATVRRADWIVSMPKLKTHHWAGTTGAMKNLFGIMPGIVYGWPKNVLHHVGIPASILDINATVPPQLAIVDGIVGMEGDGPIMGEPRHVGRVVVGRNATAVDATCARIMGLEPRRIEYLARASGRLGPIHGSNIFQRGEVLEAVRPRFRTLDLPHLQQIVSG